MSSRRRHPHSKPKNWINRAVDRGRGNLHRALGIPLGAPIPEGQIEAAAKLPGKIGRQARLALNLRRLNRPPKPRP